ncbi:hypothetical protein BV22DRAFT_122433 [Leucogyrophana mollusca]|uniref:Uncharacterized protein n=1 Tax=Leucogyrophana mollusca TaxID=85980 RepID=A0ACB8BWP2_9AGAM|nr:hypothetical protein BV22DRAFT_122433 [Leucogyrophana mollusca]
MPTSHLHCSPTGARGGSPPAQRGSRWCIDPRKTVYHLNLRGAPVPANDGQMPTVYQDDPNLQYNEKYIFQFPLDVLPTAILAAACERDVTPEIQHTATQATKADQMVAMGHTAAKAGHGIDNASIHGPICPSSPFSAHRCSYSPGPFKPLPDLSNLSSSLMGTKEEAMSPKAKLLEAPSLHHFQSVKAPPSSPKFKSTCVIAPTPPQPPALPPSASSDPFFPYGAQSLCRDPSSLRRSPSWAPQQPARLLGEMLIDNEFIESGRAASGDILYVHECRWDLHRSPCRSWIGSDRSFIGKHLQKRHRMREAGGNAYCNWDGCGMAMLKGSIPRHIVSIHLSHKSSLSRARMIDVGQLSEDDSSRKKIRAA